MRVSAYRSLVLRLAGLVLFFVLINAGTYILVLQRFAGGRATYYPFVVSTVGAIILALFFAWKSGGTSGNFLTRTVLCLSSAAVVGSAVVLLSLFVIVNTLGS